ncbi:hypothetical protein ACFLWA_12640 [Chloroflexota bacterium]
MVSSITNVADLAQVSLGDSAGTTWSQGDVEDWVTEAIRDYGSHFHRILHQTITMVTGTNNYNLENSFLAPVLVEYPKGEDPPLYLDRLSRKDPRFWAGTKFYDIEEYAKAEDAGQIWISATVTTAEQVYLTYQALYYDPDADIAETNCYVPDQHLPLLVLFVQWKATVERLNDELQAPDRSINLIDDMNDAVKTARDTYDKAIDRAKAAGYQSRWTEPWSQDTYDPIY